MHITHVKIENILGIQELEFSTGAFNLVEGRNGAGKTSVLEAVKSVVGDRAGDATLLRKGSEKGETVLVLDDGHTLKKRVTENGSTLTVEKNGAKVAAPTSVIKALTDALAVNPVEFLRLGSTAAGKRARLDLMLGAVPMAIDQDRLEKIAGPVAKVADLEMPALIQLDAVYKAIFDDRTGTNRAVEEKKSTINQLELTLPSDEAGEVSGDIGELEARVAEINATRDVKLENFDEKLKTYRTESQARFDELQVQIDALRARQVVEREWMAGTEAKAAAAVAAAREAAITEASPLNTQIAFIRQNADAVSRANLTRETIERMGNELSDLMADAAKQSAALASIQAYKSELLAELPIDGLSVQDGEIYRHGIVFDRLNKAQQVDIAVEIAKLRSGELGVICVDELEMLDDEQFAAFQEKSIASGLQLFVTRRNNSDRSIQTAG